MRFLNQGRAISVPTFTSITANTGEDWDTITTHAVVGTQFQNGITVVAKTGGGSTIGSCGVTYNSSTSLTLTMPAYAMPATASTEAINLIFTNPDTGTVTASSAFTYSWSPYSLAPWLWFRFDRGVTTGGGVITAATNLGSGGAGWNVAPDTLSPAFSATDSDWNNKPSVNFADENHFLKSGNGNTIAQPFTMWAFVKYPAGSPVVANTGLATFDDTTSRIGVIGKLSTGNAYVYPETLIENGAAGGKTLHIGVVDIAGPNACKVYNNSRTASTTGTQATTLAGSNSRITLGMHPLGIPVPYALAGTGVEFGAMSGVISANQVNRLADYSGSFFGHTIA